jgi:metallo-beta-lactamase family protein
MCTAGRIKHHLAQQIGRRVTTVLFVGYQAAGTLGRQILEGRKEVRIHGQMLRVRAQVEQIQGFSAHADRSTLMRWASHLKAPPRKVFLTHGEPEAAAALLGLVRGKLGFDTTIPDYGQSFDLA